MKKITLLMMGVGLTSALYAQSQYRAPQDTVTKRLSPDQSLSSYSTSLQPYSVDSRFANAAQNAAKILADTTKYQKSLGVSVESLFNQKDLEYVVKQGVNGVAVLFDLINKDLPKGKSITFRTGDQATVLTSANPLVLSKLRAYISDKQVLLSTNKPQWKENVYQAYAARDYGTKLENTITITSATREIRETPNLHLIDYNGETTTLAKILAQNQRNEKATVLAFREHTFPNFKITKEKANENYRRALFQLIDLQENDINTHPATNQLVNRLTNDLKKGTESKTVNSLKNSHFFDKNVPGNMGAVLLTESNIIDGNTINANARDKALELVMLTALHYGERDAVKLFTAILDDKGSYSSGDQKFSAKRLNELTYHGTEKLKSVGLGKDKVQTMSSSDLVLVAVSSPDVPTIIKPQAYISLQDVTNSIVNYYNYTNVIETKRTILFNPRISLGTRHTEYRAAFDAVDYVPEIGVNQKGSRVTQNGLELRLESDLYFANNYKILTNGVKPFIYPEFGVIAGAGTRNVGYDDNTALGRFGAVPQFKNTYFNWGGHIGLNIGALLIAEDATYLTTGTNTDPYKRFFDLSQGMTYYRYTALLRIFNFGMGKTEVGKGSYLLLDGEYSGETNNTGYKNRTITNANSSQTGNDEWSRDYNRAHPGGVFNQAIATAMIVNGDVKASYASSSYAALHLGLQKGAFLFKLTGGLYNLYTVPITGEKILSVKTIHNTFNGNLFGAFTITYNFGSNSLISKHYKSEGYSKTNDTVNGDYLSSESSSETRSKNKIRNRVIFTNKKSK